LKILILPLTEIKENGRNRKYQSRRALGQKNLHCKKKVKEKAREK
jgi:hypothetical protein